METIISFDSEHNHEHNHEHNRVYKSDHDRLFDDLFLLDTPESIDLAIAKFSKFTANLNFCGNMLLEAFKAVCSIEGGWEFLLMYETGSFMLRLGSDGGDVELDPIDLAKLKEIENAVGTSFGHSGASFGLTMRDMEFIAKYGLNAYMEKNNSNDARSSSPVGLDSNELNKRKFRYVKWLKSRIPKTHSSDKITKL